MAHRRVIAAALAAALTSPGNAASPRSDAERAALIALPAAAGDARPKAWTRGDFEIAYVLVEESGAVRAREVAVRVRNQTRLPAAPSAALREHEEVHRRINETGARDLEAAMAAFAVAASTPPVSLRGAERLFRADFRRRVRAVEELHAAWDANHKVRD